MEIELGDKVKDVITGFEGIAIARSQWLYGCDRIVVSPLKLSPEGGTRCNETFDIMQLEVVEKQTVKPPQPQQNTPKKERGRTAKKGGPQNDKAAQKLNQVT